MLSFISSNFQEHKLYSIQFECPTQSFKTPFQLIDFPIDFEAFNKYNTIWLRIIYLSFVTIVFTFGKIDRSECVLFATESDSQFLNLINKK